MKFQKIFNDLAGLEGRPITKNKLQPVKSEAEQFSIVAFNATTAVPFNNERFEQMMAIDI